MSDHILVEYGAEADQGIATVILNKPDTHNAITQGMYRQLPEVFGELDADPAVKVVVLRGAGTRAWRLPAISVSPTNIPDSGSPRPSSGWSTAWSPPNASSIRSVRPGPSGSCSPASTFRPRTRCASA
ncbi:MAG: enoyl-CoA hydratase [Mycobacterium sp.]|nr:enoyl-CoA hydratase [Mycobacterium sp.]